MPLASSLAFFLVIFLVASILTAIAYLAFLKMKADESDAERSDLSPYRNRSTRRNGPKVANNWASASSPPFSCRTAASAASLSGTPSTRSSFDFGAILQNRLEQADLRWSVGRITSMMLLIGIVTLAVLMRLLPLWAASLGCRRRLHGRSWLCAPSPHQALY